MAHMDGKLMRTRSPDCASRAARVYRLRGTGLQAWRMQICMQMAFLCKGTIRQAGGWPEKHQSIRAGVGQHAEKSGC